jgi:hypothetical protein
MGVLQRETPQRGMTTNDGDDDNEGNDLFGVGEVVETENTTTAKEEGKEKVQSGRKTPSNDKSALATEERGI